MPRVIGRCSPCFCVKRRSVQLSQLTLPHFTSSQQAYILEYCSVISHASLNTASVCRLSRVKSAGAPGAYPLWPQARTLRLPMSTRSQKVRFQEEPEQQASLRRPRLMLRAATMPSMPRSLLLSFISRRKSRASQDGMDVAEIHAPIVTSPQRENIERQFVLMSAELGGPPTGILYTQQNPHRCPFPPC